MKNLSLFQAAAHLIFLFAPLTLCTAQKTDPKDKIAVLQLDAKGFTLDPVQMGNLARLELDKLGLFEVMDPYDVSYLLEKEQFNPQNCYGKICLVEAGHKLKADKMLSGSVELLGDNIVITLRVIDVATVAVEKSQVQEFLNLKNQIQPMLGITLQQMFGITPDENLRSKLTKRFDYESAVNVPEAARLNLSGPRMGITFFGGETAARFRAPEGRGGLDAAPVMFQFGYQFETAYLNQGGLQALFEFVPVITGLDQGHFLPSFSFLHGLRSNRNGFEFAFGPIIYLTREAEGAYNANQEWVLLEDWSTLYPNDPKPTDTYHRFDSRGDFAVATSFVFAFGKSFKSGRMNIPVNAFFIPSREGHRFGISVGFNGRG